MVYRLSFGPGRKKGAEEGSLIPAEGTPWEKKGREGKKHFLVCCICSKGIRRKGQRKAKSM